MSVGNTIRLAVLAILLLLLLQPELFAGFFGLFTKNNQPAIYNQGNLLDITINHLLIVGAATLAATVIAVGLAVPQEG
jgi:osmoprotectant transport system permease protein